MNLYKNQIISVSLAEMVSRIIYYGLQASLVLCLVHKFNLSDSESYDIYCLYTALTFGLSVLGGIIADKYIGHCWAAIIGGVLISLGNIFLCFNHLFCFIYGLSILAIGMGFFKPNSASLLGGICDKNKINKSRAFSTFYLLVNIGSFIGPLLYGINTVFAAIFSSIFMIIAMAYLFSKVRRNEITRVSTFIWRKVFFWILLLTISVISLMCYLKSAQIVMFLVAIAVFLSVFKNSSSIKNHEKIALLSMILPLACCIIYFACLLQIYSSISLFIDRNIDRHIFGYNIPTSWFGALEPCFILFSVPLLNYIWSWANKKNIEPNENNKIIIGFLLSAIGFVLFSIIAMGRSTGFQSIMVIIIANFIFAFSDICVFPVMMALFNSAAPEKYKSTIMGAFYFAFSMSGYLSGYIAKFSSVGAHQLSFCAFFNMVSMLLFVICIVNFYGSCLLNKFFLNKYPALLET